MIALLLADSLHGLNWQGMGSGMNNTVITEIWTGFEANMHTALRSGDKDLANGFVNEISTRLNDRWNPAWNIAVVVNYKIYDSILYGYAFRNQSMWYNGVPQNLFGSSMIITLIVWKDYNCQDWKNIANGVTETSSFTTAKKDLIRAEMNKMTSDGIKNDVWATAFTMMDSLNKKTEFSSGGYTVIMSQYGGASIYGRVCRVGDGFYNSYRELGDSSIGS